MRPGGLRRRTRVSCGGQRFEEAEEAVESMGWIGRRYSYGAQVFWCIVEGCFATSVCLHERCHSLYVPVMLHPWLCTNRIVSSVSRVGPNAYSMLIECNACM